MIKVGDEVITMSAVGRFQVMAVRGDTVVLRNAAGVEKTVHIGNVRHPRETPATGTGKPN